MNMLANLATSDDINSESDSVGGGGPVETGIYPGVISLAYMGESSGGAMSLTLHLKTEGREVRQTIYVTSGRAKGQKNYYEKNGEKNYLPGFSLGNNLALLTVGKELAQLEPEEKVVNLWNFEAKAEVATKAQVLTELIGQEVIAAIFKQTVDKNVKNGTGAYVPSGETRDENEIDKFFRARDRMTAAEILAQADEAVFINTWEEKWAGKTRNLAKGASGAQGAAGLPGGAAPAAVSGKPTASLFS